MWTIIKFYIIFIASFSNVWWLIFISFRFLLIWAGNVTSKLFTMGKVIWPRILKIILDWNSNLLYFQLLHCCSDKLWPLICMSSLILAGCTNLSFLISSDNYCKHSTGQGQQALHQSPPGLEGTWHQACCQGQAPLAWELQGSDVFGLPQWQSTTGCVMSIAYGAHCRCTRSEPGMSPKQLHATVCFCLFHHQQRELAWTEARDQTCRTQMCICPDFCRLWATVLLWLLATNDA